MESTENAIEDLPVDGVTVTAGLKHETFRLRTYQAEMVEKSLEGNIIVAMDTGSGKTHIALARTAAELEICDARQLVWFLAPTVTLCEQQFSVFQKALPAYGITLLSGRDGVEHWSDQAMWDGVLNNARIILSTHAVLLDALTHAFVRMERLALIIFDEAHHCTRKHPANQIMTNFYRPFLSENGGACLPRILGLSASPVMRAKVNRSGLEQIEENMNAIAKTPKTHRSELIRYVHKPELLEITYATNLVPVAYPLLDALCKVNDNYDIETDPWVANLLRKQRQGFDCSRQLQEISISQKTYCAEQLRKFANKAQAMYDELGLSAADWYIHQCIWKFEEMTRSSDVQLVDWSSSEKDHLLKIFKSLPLSKNACSPIALDQLSPKLQKLIDVLIAEAGEDFTGLVFVEQRVQVAALAEILSLHPQTLGLLNIGTFVGTSQSSKRKTNVADLVEVRNQQETLDDFRVGKKNIILTTSVLEEGIDISSCHVVICFERPKNLKSFIQRRGRARKQKSKYLIFQDLTGSSEIWETLEEEMKAAYLNDLRQVQQAEERESIEEEGDMFYKVTSTGALLSLDNALPHLHHFCSLLGSGPFIDSRPQFSFITAGKTQDGSMNSLISAEVMLPISVDFSVRKAEGSQSWNTERMAKKDAAFQAYKGLYMAGLVNDHLLPARQDEEDMMQEFQIPDHTPSLVEVSPSFDPWVLVARYQQQNPHTYWRHLLKIHTTGEDPLHMIFITPYLMPEVPAFVLHWNAKTQYTVESSWLPGAVFNEEDILTLRAITRKFLHQIYHGRMQERSDFLWLFAPSDVQCSIWDHTKLVNFDDCTNNHRSAIDCIQENRGIHAWGLVSYQGDGRKYMLKGISSEPMESSTGLPAYQLQAIRAPKRRDFLHRTVESNAGNAYTRIEKLNAAECVVDNLPTSYSVFALFVPAILRMYEIFMVAETLRITIISPVAFEVSHLPLLVQALTSSAASAEKNYQRLEFLGDCILKFIASVHLMAANITWPESFLTGKKGRIVSNGFLARATMKAGLDKYIINKNFTGAKWSPRYAGDVLRPQEETSKKIALSSKLLADVIESLIGASYVKGGFSDAFVCVRTLLTAENWMSISDANTALFNATPRDFTPNNLSTLESLIGYAFDRKVILLEAITHASYIGPNAHCSYERHEFLGDAVLDYIITKRLFEHKPELSHQKMHAMRSSMANASFLTFRMFETTVEETAPQFPNKKPEIVRRALWQFMRHNSPHIIGAREAAVAQHNSVREQILDSLHHDSRFPWHLFSLTDAAKFLSDIVESVIGGIYIDSQGSIAACEGFVRRLGILDALERLLEDGVDCLHPKERLGHLAVEKSVEYVKIVDEPPDGPSHDSKGKANGNKKTYKCQVKVGGVEIGGPVEGLKRLNAETIAAWKAINIMEAEQDVEMGMSSEEEWHDADEGGGGIALDSHAEF